ncbi:MAG TPA: hypothetical protein VLN59_02885, partial [Burkholderiales bacterium]|nr:hypothetical protein [Burkholderiales bacterium]
LVPAAYRERLRQAVIDNRQTLVVPTFGLDAGVVDAIVDKLTAFLRRHARAFDERLQRKLIVEGHGDLRPEHVCLAAEPVFIDCLEFNRELRIVDPADELGYLAMESELLGAACIGDVVFETYAAVTGDIPDTALVRFYQAQRALLRARLAVGHLEDGVTNSTRAKWLTRAHAYLSLAERYTSSL